MILPGTYQGLSLPREPSFADLKAILPDYAALCATAMQAIADRYDPAYPFINTKLDLITGADFPADDPIRGKNAIYGWIQGRALEALAGHARWLAPHPGHETLVESLELAMRQVLRQLRGMREKNGGHLSFFMLPDGTPFELNAKGQPVPLQEVDSRSFGFSDLFASKGMYAAARYLGDTATTTEVRSYIDAVEAAIWDNTFRTDQISLDPRNPIELKSGYHPHAPYMIQIGSVTMLVESAHPKAIERGLTLIEHVLSSHANLDGRVADMAEGDLWEGVADDGTPYRHENGAVLSDPGHALEFVGLAMKFIRAAQMSGAAEGDQHDRLTKAGRQLPTVLFRSFSNGYIDDPGGISKAFDLVTRRHLNTDMPWWSLPEGVRAAAYCLANNEVDAIKEMILEILRDCHNAFLKFVRPDLHLMAYQTRDVSGNPVAVIPATADADPGYHTGLSLIDTIHVLEAIE